MKGIDIGVTQPRTWKSGFAYVIYPEKMVEGDIPVAVVALDDETLDDMAQRVIDAIECETEARLYREAALIAVRAALGMSKVAA